MVFAGLRNPDDLFYWHLQSQPSQKSCSLLPKTAYPFLPSSWLSGIFQANKHVQTQAIRLFSKTSPCSLVTDFKAGQAFTLLVAVLDIGKLLRLLTKGDRLDAQSHRLGTPAARQEVDRHLAGLQVQQTMDSYPWIVGIAEIPDVKSNQFWPRDDEAREDASQEMQELLLIPILWKPNNKVMQVPSGQPTMLPALLLAWATFCCLCDSLEGSEGET